MNWRDIYDDGKGGVKDKDKQGRKKEKHGGDSGKKKKRKKKKKKEKEKKKKGKQKKVTACGRASMSRQASALENAYRLSLSWCK